MGMCSLQLLCPGSSSPIQTASDLSWHPDPNLQVKMSLQKCHTFIPYLRAIQRDSSHHFIHQNSSHRHNSNHRSMKCQWNMSVQIPEFPSLSLISSFQDLRDQFFDVLPLCEPLAPLVPLDFALNYHLISLLLPLPSLSHHALPDIACLCSCVHCSLVENVLHRTQNTHHARDSMTLFLCQTREN